MAQDERVPLAKKDGLDGGAVAVVHGQGQQVGARIADGALEDQAATGGNARRVELQLGSDVVDRDMELLAVALVVLVEPFETRGVVAIVEVAMLQREVGQSRSEDFGT